MIESSRRPLVGTFALVALACSSPDPTTQQNAIAAAAAGTSAGTAPGGQASGAVTASSGGAGNAMVVGAGGTISAQGPDGTPTGAGGTATEMVGMPTGLGGAPVAMGGTPVGMGGAPAGAGGAITAMGAAAGMAGAVSTPTGSGACTFTVTQSLSEKITTVGIVEFDVDVALDSATLDFGLDTNYGLTAPVDLAEPKHRTLLLGMKPAKDYHFRVNAVAGGMPCTSADFTLHTGDIPNDVPVPEVTQGSPDQTAPGYMITARWGNNTKGPAMILDHDNEVVWWYPGEDDIIRARMSFDGKSMWMRNTGQTDGTGLVQRVSMDGLNAERWELPHTTHDLAVLPDGKVALVAHTSGCDEITEFDPDTGELKSVFNVEQAHGKTVCHVNYVAYSEIDDSYYISDYDASSYIKISRAGQLLWVVNGDGSTISGGNWSREHGCHVLESNHLLIFSNGSGQASYALEYKIDEQTKTATELWRYDAGISASFGGDIQRLGNGNTLITYSSAGVMQELNATGEVVQELTWPNTVSYTVKRASLYGGPPPKIYDYEAGNQ